MEPYLKDEAVFYPHQIEGIRTLMKKRNFLLADDMGLGKSLQALTVFCGDVITGRGHICIIVCPVSLRANWANEITKFTRIPFMLLGQEYSPVTGRIKTLTPAGRRAQLEEFASWQTSKILILNYEQVDPHLKELNALKAHVAIYDEAHTIKNPQAKRTKACLALKTNRSFMLTGSPVMNHVHELWPMLNKIAPDHFPNYYKFRNRYCVMGGYESKQVVGVKNRQELHAVLQQIMVRRLKKDVLDLPDVMMVDVLVDLHPNQEKLYKSVDEDFVLPDPNASGKIIDNAMEIMLRLLQICSTPACIGHPDDSYKLDRVVEDTLQLQEDGEKVVIFTRFRPVIAALKQRFETEGNGAYYLHGDVKQQDRQSVIDTWSKDPENRPMIAMLQVAGVGLNMVASRNVSFVDRLFVPMLNKQAIDRCHRIGQDKSQPVMVRDYIAAGTIEKRVMQILRGKTKMFESVIEEVNIRARLLEALRRSDEDE